MFKVPVDLLNAVATLTDQILKNINISRKVDIRIIDEREEYFCDPMKFWIVDINENDNSEQILAVENYRFEPTENKPRMLIENQEAISRMAPMMLITPESQENAPLHPRQSVVIAPSTAFSVKNPDDTWNNRKVDRYEFQIVLSDDHVDVKYKCWVLGPNGSPSYQGYDMHTERYDWWWRMKPTDIHDKALIESRMNFAMEIAI